MVIVMDLETLRRPKILGMSIFDWFTSLLGAYVVGRWFHFRTRQQWISWLIFWVLFGVFVHAIFGVNTMLGYYLGLNPKPLR
jgi:hypothetical protein